MTSSRKKNYGKEVELVVWESEQVRSDQESHETEKKEPDNTIGMRERERE